MNLSRKLGSTIYAFGAAGVLLTAAATPLVMQAQSKTISAHQQLAHDIFRELIEINTKQSEFFVPTMNSWLDETLGPVKRE